MAACHVPRITVHKDAQVQSFLSWGHRSAVKPGHHGLSALALLRSPVPSAAAPAQGEAGAPGPEPLLLALQPHRSPDSHQAPAEPGALGPQDGERGAPSPVTSSPGFWHGTKQHQCEPRPSTRGLQTKICRTFFLNACTVFFFFFMHWFFNNTHFP